MSVKVMSWVWEHSRAEGTSRLVLLAIADNAHDDGRDAWPSQETIARKCRISVRTVRRAVTELVALGELEVEAFKGPRADGVAGRHTHRYFVTMLADNLSGNPGEVGGHDREVGGQTAQGWRTPVSGEPLEPSLEPSAEEVVHWKENDLVARMVDHFGPRHAERSREVVRELLATLDWHEVDRKIGIAIAAGAYSPNFLVGSKAVAS